MTKTHQRRPLLFLLAVVILSSSVIYAVMWGFHSALPFQQTNYTQNSHHFLLDARINGGPFVFLRALGQYDAQWYLRIATNGYPAHPTNIDMQDKTAMDGLTYAFFPLYPLLIAALNVLVGNVELSAFLLSNLLIILNTISLYLLIQKLYNPSIAVKTTLLLFLFPFSIFFRSYFAEGLQLLFLIWFAYCMSQKRMLPAACVLACLNVTKGNSMLLIVYFGIYLVWRTLTHQEKWLNTLIALLISGLPLAGWVLFNYIQTGDPLYFHSVYQSWDSTPLYLNASMNVLSMVSLFSLPLHYFEHSFIDSFIAIATLVMLVFSWKRLPSVLWWIGFILWLTPFISHNLMSFSRYQSVSFPLFLFLALLLRNKKAYIPVAIIFSGLLILTSLYFINWYWVG